MSDELEIIASDASETAMRLAVIAGDITAKTETLLDNQLTYCKFLESAQRFSELAVQKSFESDGSLHPDSRILQATASIALSFNAVVCAADAIRSTDSDDLALSVECETFIKACSHETNRIKSMKNNEGSIETCNAETTKKIRQITTMPSKMETVGLESALYGIALRFFGDIPENKWPPYHAALNEAFGLGKRDQGRTKPRPQQSNRDTVIKLLSRAEGATLLELMAIADWKMNTATAFIANLKKEPGVKIKKVKAIGERATFFYSKTKTTEETS